MPTEYNLPEYVGAQSQQDVNLYNKLPFYLATMQVKRQAFYNTFNKLWGTIPWQPNQGSTMKAVEAVHTPIGRQFFSPMPITGAIRKDVFVNLERTEQCNVLMHDFDSKQIYFLPSFQDFRTGQVDFTHDDIVKQMNVASDQFVRTVMLQKSKFVFIVGNRDAAAVNLGTPELVAAPSTQAGENVETPSATSTGKTTSWFKDAASKVGAEGLSMTTIDRMMLTLRDDLGAPFFEGGVNMPKDNELLKGKYVFIGSMEAFGMLKYDPWVKNLRDINWNIVMDGFSGSPWNEITWKSERYPLRMDNDGNFPVPEIVDDTGDTVVNPEYAAANFEWGFLCGADAYKTIKIGPPPKPFAGGSMSLDQFNGMNWNGEVQLTRDLFVQYLDVDNNTVLQPNNRGRFVMFVSSLTMGCLATRSRNAIPVLYRRARPAAQLGAAVA